MSTFPLSNTERTEAKNYLIEDDAEIILNRVEYLESVGVSGYSGISGYSGTSGFSGYSGTSGFSGYSGKSGYSGTSGYSGISGYSGNNANDWLKTGNTGNIPGTNFIGNLDNIPFDIFVAGFHSGRIESSVGGSNSNTFIGFQALYNSIGANNTAIGTHALDQITTGSNNTAVGAIACSDINNTGDDNVAIGYNSGDGAAGSRNTFLGVNTNIAPFSIGNNNILLGYNAGTITGAENDCIIGDISGTGYEVQVGIATNVLPANARLCIKDGHFQVQQTTAPTDGGGTWTVSFTTANDTAGKIAFTTTALAGTAIVTFNMAYATAPIVVITPANANATTALALAFYVTSTTTTFTINYAASPGASLLNFNYHVIETE